MLKYLSKQSLNGKRVLVRTDFNVPIVGSKVKDDFRIRAHLPTLIRLLAGSNSLVIISHHSDRRQTLKPVAGRLAGLLETRVVFVENPFDEDFWAARGRGVGVFLVENLRAWPGEEANELEFARNLAKLGDVFVNDAFGVAHRVSASNVLLPRLLPSYLGLLFERELCELNRATIKPRRPLVAVFGGAKIETKLRLLKRFSRWADKLCVGGMVGNVLLAARGIGAGRSLVKGYGSSDIKKIARAKNLVLPVDVVTARSKSGKSKISSVDAIGKNELILDIGPKTVALFNRAVSSAGTIVWNGPFGFAEIESFGRGTLGFARALVRKQNVALIGGGDTAAFLDKAGLLNKFKHVSTGGGAMLAYISGERLPALEALRESSKLKS